MNTYEKIGSSMIEATTVYGPPEVRTQNTYTTSGNTVNQTSNTKTENNSVALVIANIVISVVVIILGCAAVFSKKLSKTSKIVLVIAFVAIGALLLVLANNIPNLAK